MKRIDALRAKAEKDLARQRELVKLADDAGREMTADEVKEYDALSTAVDKTLADIDREKQLTERADRVAAVKPAAKADDNAEDRDTAGTVKDAATPRQKSPARHTGDMSELDGVGKVGVFAWAAARMKQYPAGDPYDFIEAVGLGQIADEGRACRAKMHAVRSVDKALLSVSGAGANLVDVPLSTDFIEFLRNGSSFLAARPTEFAMPFGGIEIPGGSVGASATYGAEGADIGYTQATTRKVSMSAKHIRAVTSISNYLLDTSPLAVATIFGQDLANGIVSGIDAAGLRGDGSGNNPTGLRSLVNAAHIVAAAAAVAPTLAQIDTHLKALKTAVDNSNVPERRRVWIIAPRVFNYMMFMRDGNGNYAFPGLHLPQPVLHSYPVFRSTQVPINLGAGTNESEIYLQDFGHVLMGVTRTLQLKSSDQASYIDGSSNHISAFARDETVVRGTASHDFDMRHDKSGAIGTAVQWGA